MRGFLVMGALVAVVLPLTPAVARQAEGYTVRSTELLAGPDNDYPMVRRLRANVGVTVYGCLRNWSWCDVSYGYDRGWIDGRDIVVNYRGHRSRIMPSMGIGVLSFMFGTYWDNHYRSRPFYSERPRWEQNYHNNYRPEWGSRPQPPVLAPQRRQPGGEMRQGSVPYRPTAPVRPPVVNTPRTAPQQRQPQVIQPPRMTQPQRGAPIQHAAPSNADHGNRPAPGRQGQGGQDRPQGQKSQGQQNKDQKSRD